MSPMADTSSSKASMAMFTYSSHISQDMLLATVPYAVQCMGVRRHMESKPYPSSATRNTFTQVLCESRSWKRDQICVQPLRRQLQFIAGPQSAYHCKQLEQILEEIVNIRNPLSQRKVIISLAKHINPKSSININSNIMHGSQHQGEQGYLCVSTKHQIQWTNSMRFTSSSPVTMIIGLSDTRVNSINEHKEISKNRLSPPSWFS